MPRIAFPTGLKGSENLPRTKENLQNCWNNGEGSIISRPGIQELKTTGSVARGGFVWNGSYYQVVSQRLIKITNTVTGDFIDIGTIADSAQIRTAIGFNTAVIVVNDSVGRIYTLDDSDNLVDIRGNSNFVSCTSVAHIDGRFIYIPFDGDPAFFSDVGNAGSVQALSFFDAEALPDRNSAAYNYKDTLYIAGTDSIQPFRNTGASPNPFIPIQGARIDYGFIGGLLEAKDAFMFVGREKDQDFGIYAVKGGQTVKISNETIDLFLANYTQEELKETIPGRFKWRGYDIATFALREDSFGYLNGNWFRLSTHFDESTGPWRAGFITQHEGTYYTAYADKIGKFSMINSDYGGRIARIMETFEAEAETRFFRTQSLEFGISQGYNTNPGSVALFLSHNNVTYGPGIYRNLGDIGNYDPKLIWNPSGGLGTYKGFLGIRVYTTESVDFSGNYIVVKRR